jgi:aspartate racemase
MHIGLIAGIGPAATDFYYRGLVDRHRAANLPLEVTLCHADVGEMARNLADGQPEKQAKIFAGLVARMKAAGAEAAAITSMGGHFCVKELIAISPLPILNGLPAVSAAIAARKLKTIGVLGTRQVMGSQLYGSVPSAELIAPEGPAFDQVADAYSAMAGIGRVTEAQRQIFFDAGRKLVARGAEAIMLGGTDLFLAFVGQAPGFPVIDCADLHVDALYLKSSA